MSMVYGDEVCSAVVIDVGSSTTKVGFAGQEHPERIFSSAIGTWQDDGDMVKSASVNRREVWHARYRANMPVEVEHPVVQGLVYDWDLLEKVWQHSFETQLGLDMSQHPVISVDQAFSPRASQDHTAELLFESVGVPAMYLGKSAVLSTLAAGKSTGMVVESGGGVSSAVAVVDGVVVNRGWHYSALSGDSVSDHLYDLIQTGRDSTLKQLPSLNPLHCAGGPKVGGAGDVFASYIRHMERALVREVKETLCQLPETMIAKDSQVPGLATRLPDGNEIELQAERFDVPELIITGDSADGSVSPATVAKLAARLPRGHHCSNFDTLPLVLHTAIMKCEETIQRDLYTAITICGGNSLFPRAQDRLAAFIINEFDVASTYTTGRMVSKIDVAQRKWASWVGGSILGSFPSFAPMWVTQAEYQEGGKGVLAKKCP